MIIKNITSQWIGGATVLSAEINHDNSDGKHQPLWFRIEGINKPPLELGDPFLAGLLLPCMLEQEDLEIESPVSNSLLINILNVQDIMSNWYPELKKIKIKSPVFYDDHINNNRDLIACFFSGGVDSLYTLCSHLKEVTYLILIHGFDISLDDEKLWNKTLQNTRTVAEEMGKKIITIQTNIREVADKRYSKLWKEKHSKKNSSWWPSVLFGSSLASAGLCLQENLDIILISSAGRSREKLLPWGSHPDLDKFWSTEKLKFTHDELEKRINKIKYLSKYPLFLKNLRVCYSKNIENINCGICEKCIRTIVAMELSGIKPSGDTFDKIPDIKNVKTTCFSLKGPVYFQWEQMLEEATLQGNNELADVISIVLGRKFSFYRYSIMAIHKIQTLSKRIFRKAKRKIPLAARRRIKNIYNMIISKKD